MIPYCKFKQNKLDSTRKCNVLKKKSIIIVSKVLCYNNFYMTYGFSANE